MEERKRVTTRRGAIARMLGVAAGAAGIGAFAESKANAKERVASTGAELQLYAPNMRQSRVGPSGSSTYMPYGTLVDAKGHVVGTFHTAMLDSTAGAVTFQTFELDGGTIVGVGSSETFVVLGSSGAYAAVAGSYTERPATHLPGRQFTFTFREGSHGS